MMDEVGQILRTINLRNLVRHLEKALINFSNMLKLSVVGLCEKG